MTIYTDIEKLSDLKKTIITIGSFDGVHLGHQKILKQINVLAKKHDAKTVLITFQQHPRLVIDKIHPLSILLTLQEKCELLKQHHVTHCVALPFTKEFSEMKAEKFISDFLVPKFSPLFIVVGYDHQFGKNRLGNIHLLKQYEAMFNYKVEEISPLLIDELKTSSSVIRRYLQEGEIEKANNHLGYNYFLQGSVIQGKQLGRTIGFPTANIFLSDNNKLIPAKGVYAVDIKINDENKKYKAMLNIGINPTVEHSAEIKIEANIFDFNKDIYNQSIKVYFKNKIREEIKFANIQGLKKQLEEDKRIAYSL